MTIRQYSLWDTLGESARIRDVWSSTPDGVRHKRMLRRTKLFDSFIASIEQTGGLSDADRTRLVRAYRHRAKRWHVHLETPSEGMTASDYSSGFDGNGLGDLVDVFCDGGFLAGLAAIVALGATLGLLFIPLFALPWYFFKVRKHRRCRKAVENRICPDCKCDLTHCRPAVAPDWIEGLCIGPRRCPECSAPWPLLPPPSRSGLE